MIPYTRDPRQIIPTSSVKIIGLGGAGANMLERIALDGMEGAELLALNTDIRTLGACLAREKIQLGVNLTKGLGAGGDPELGHQAVLEAEEQIRAAVKGRRIVFLCTGLGGGTGSGAAPIVTRIAREEGAFVVVFATMPFAFEGKRRRDQAETALNELAVLSNALVTFDNNRMGELVLAKQGIHEAFIAADHMICESIKAVIRLVIRPGLINVGLDDLMSALRTNRSRCLFGSGIAEGKDRATSALRNALASPLLDQGALLKDAQTVLVHLCGGEDLTLFEIELLMQRLQKFVPESAHVLFGAAIDPAMGDSLSTHPDQRAARGFARHGPARIAEPSSPDNPILDPSRDSPRRPVNVADIRTRSPAVSPEACGRSRIRRHRRGRAGTAFGIGAPQPSQPRRTRARLAALEIPPFGRGSGGRGRAPPTLFDRNARSPNPNRARPAAPEPLRSTSRILSPSRSRASNRPKPCRGGDPPDRRPRSRNSSPLSRGASRSPGARGYQSATRNRRRSPPSRTRFAADRRDSELDTPLPNPPGLPPIPRKRPAGRHAVVHRQGTQNPRSRSWIRSTRPGRIPPEPEPPKLKLGIKAATPQSELSLDSTPRGRFEGESPNVFEGEDLDLPPFLRKKK